MNNLIPALDFLPDKPVDINQVSVINNLLSSRFKKIIPIVKYFLKQTVLTAQFPYEIMSHLGLCSILICC